MDAFTFQVPTRVIFGKDTEVLAGEQIAACGGKRVLLHFGGASALKSGLIDRVETSLHKAGLSVVRLGGVVPNPVLPTVREGIRLAAEEQIDFILAVGGGSVIDSAKAIAVGVANPGTDVWDFSAGKATPTAALPVGVVLTLSAAGSETSDSCVITNPETGEKRGFNTPFNRPVFALENPELTYTVSPYQTACGAVDIAMHTMERFFTPASQETLVTDELAGAVIRSIRQAADRCLADPADYAARGDMMWVSGLAHNGLTGCGRGKGFSVHQLEHEVSGFYPGVAHGAGLAALWCSWARYVYKAALPRFVRFAELVWGLRAAPGNEEATVLAAIDKQEAYYRSIGMPVSLAELGVEAEKLPAMALSCSRNKSRLVPGVMPLAYEDVLAIYRLAL